jgi:hypothetical protein
MGIRTFNKYLALFKVAAVLVQEGMKWLEKARDDDSPGGEDIVSDEYVDLIPVIEKAIRQGLGVTAKVKLDEG